MIDTRTRLVAGCMTGTSLDGLDVALVRITGAGLDMKAQLLAHRATPMPGDLRSTLMHLASGGAAEPIVYLRAARALGELHAEALEQLAGDAPGETIDFVTAHGQTVWHAPRDDASLTGGGPKSWQLFDPWPVVRKLKRPVCYDLRQADLIAGGEGAPLTPIADWVMYRGRASYVINLGGIANVTCMALADQPSMVRAKDIGPCNILLDGLAKRLLNKPYDIDGQAAISGTCSRDAESCFTKAFAQTHRHDSHIRSARSLGREQFSTAWFDELAAELSRVTTAADALQTTVTLISFELADCIERDDMEMAPETKQNHSVVLAGGGTRNRALVRAVRQSTGYQNAVRSDVRSYSVTLSDALGIPCEAREAMAFAVLGALSQDGVPISLPQVTGAKDPGVAGVWAKP